MNGAPTEWTLKGFCSHFKFVHDKIPDHAFAWVLGAGASKPSGISTGSELVTRWLKELHERLDANNLPFDKWATADNLGIEAFDLQKAPSFYPRIYERRFRDNPDEGYACLEDLMSEKEPSPGYSILAKTMETQRHKVVITTNFDNLAGPAMGSKSRLKDCMQAVERGFRQPPVVVPVGALFVASPRARVACEADAPARRARPFMPARRPRYAHPGQRRPRALMKHPLEPRRSHEEGK